MIEHLNVLFYVLFGNRLLILLLAHALRTHGVLPEILCWRMGDDTGIICRTIDEGQGGSPHTMRGN